jgi:hypothetical protein
MNEVDKAKIYAVYTRALDSGTNSVVAFRKTLHRFPQYILDDVRDAIAHTKGVETRKFYNTVYAAADMERTLRNQTAQE